MRGFTLLELMLAVSLGALLVLVSVGLFATVERTDRALAVRHFQAEEMSTMHQVVNRAMSNMLMATDAQVAEELQNRSEIIGGEARRPSRPRLLLQQDDAAARMGHTVQRLEVVVTRAPAPPGFGREWAPSELAQTMAGPTRGVFELRPDADGLLAMWWRPLPRDEWEEDGYRYHLDPREDEFAVRLATGLTRAEWLAFKNRERQSLIEAKVSHDLPAHMELHVEMSSGYAAQWMFEVQWINGPETPEEFAEEQEAEELLEQAAGAAAGSAARRLTPGGGENQQRQPGHAPGGGNIGRPQRGVDRAP